jgi:ABC-2 type transport system ATP-binding protein
MSADAQTTTQVVQPREELADNEAIVVENFSKSYGSQRVVDHLQFSVKRGEVFALLGWSGKDDHGRNAGGLSRGGRGNGARAGS